MRRIKIMKRRKTLNKYTVGEQGQITNNQPTLSPKTQKLFQFMGMMEMLSGYMSETEPTTSEEDTNEDNTVIDGIEIGDGHVDVYGNEVIEE
jgi:hypothetical protein